MTVKLVPFEAWHIEDLRVRLEDSETPVVLPPGVAEQIEQFKASYTAIDENGIVACGGFLLYWPGRRQAWACFAPDAGKHMVILTRYTREMLDVVPGRVEMTVIKSFKQGHRWAKLLGFEVETPCLRAYGPAGEDHVGYVRIT